MTDRNVAPNANTRIGVSGLYYSVTTTGLQPISDNFAIPSVGLSNPTAWYRIRHWGTIVQGATAQQITIQPGGILTTIFNPIVFTAAQIPANASYGYQFEVEWCNWSTILAQKLLLGTANVWSTPLMNHMATFVQPPFALASHGGNVDAQFFNVSANIAVAGPSIQGNMTTFEWSNAG